MAGIGQPCRLLPAKPRAARLIDRKILPPFYNRAEQLQ